MARTGHTRRRPRQDRRRLFRHLAPPCLLLPVAMAMGACTSALGLLFLGWLAHAGWLARACPQARHRPAPALRRPQAAAARSPLPAVSHPAGRRHRALVVDDHPINLLLARDLLHSLQVDVVTAADGTEALRAAVGGRFDIVFLDVQMPGMDGLEVCRRLHEQLADTCPPVVALTAHAFPHEREQFLAAGMDECLTKPVSGSHLASCLGRWLPGPPVLSCHAPRTHSGCAPTPPRPAIDRDACVRLAGGRPALARQLVRALIDTLPESLAFIHAAAHHRDGPAMRRQLHRLLGACQYAGVPGLLAESRRLHARCQAPGPAPDPQAIERLYGEGLRVLRDAYAWLGGGPSRSMTTKAST